MVSVMGVLKSGHSFVPLNTRLPNERLQYIIEDCNIPVILTDAVNYDRAMKLAAKGVVQKVIVPHDYAGNDMGSQSMVIERHSTPDDLCYIVYTSGSTGTPKGVPVSNRNLMPLLLWSKEYLCSGTSTRVLQLLPFSFDFGVFELLTTVLFGGTMYWLPPQTFQNLQDFEQAVLQHGINVFHTTPTQFGQFMQEGIRFPLLNVLHLGGEKLTQAFVQEAFKITSPQCRIINGYGPTEATITTTVFEIPAKFEQINSLPIGAPVANNLVYILDDQLNLLPPGIPGELYIGGAGVVKGYLNQEALTSYRFINNPVTGDGKVYRTGDWCVWNEAAQIVFIGRRDAQVKFKGYRIELSEIEQRLGEHASIKQATIQLIRNKQEYIAAYYVADETLDVGELQQFLAVTLPDYMVPVAYVQMKVFPLTSSGKLDVRALPVPAYELPVQESAILATVTEIQLGVLWKRILRVDHVTPQTHFFRAGGNSIKAMQLLMQIRHELKREVALKQIFLHPVLGNFAEVLADSPKLGTDIILPAPKSKHYPLSFAQRRIWVLSQLEEQKRVFNLAGAFLIQQKPNKKILEQVFIDLVSRHEILRTNFIFIEQEPRQVIRDFDPSTLPIIWHHGNEDNLLEVAHDLFMEYGMRTFDLEHDMLFRVVAVSNEKDQFMLMLFTHHIIADGWTVNNLLHEFGSLYMSLNMGKGIQQQPLAFQYKDFAYWQQAAYAGDELLEKQGEWWLQIFNDRSIPVDLPADRPRPPVKRYRGHSIKKECSQETVEIWKEFAFQQDVSLFMFLTAVTATVIYKYTGQQDVTIGTPVAGRDHLHLQNQLGVYINLLPLRIKYSGSDHFNTLLNALKAICIDSFSNSGFPFDLLVDKVFTQRDSSREPAFDIMIAYHTHTISDSSVLKKAGITPVSWHLPVSKYDLTINIYDEESGVRLVIEYDTDLFDELRIQQFMRHFLFVANKVSKGEAQSLDELSLITESEYRQLVHSFNNTQFPLPVGETIVSLIEKGVQSHSQKYAIRSSAYQFTYSELEVWSNRVANGLIDKYKIQAGDVIAIMMERSAMVPVIMLGVLKAGAAFLPIDPVMPAERIDLLLTDAQVQILITDLDAVFTGPEIWNFQHIDKCLSFSVQSPAVKIKPDDTAYIIYTSGSTGAPKGVAVSHGNLVNFVFGLRRSLNWEDNVRLLSVTSISFDIAILELLWSLTQGIQVIIHPSQGVHLSNLDLYVEEGINALQTTPSLLKLLLADATSHVFLASLKYLIIGGEAFSHDLLQQVSTMTKAAIFNAYGPTETTIWSTIKLLEDKQPITAGKPMANTSVYILDKSLRLVPVGVPGEVYIAGRGVAKGYINRSALTSERFLPDPFAKDPAVRMYATGDLGRWTFNGELDILGRTDRQVKINGYRIEPEEIENCIQQTGLVQQAVVLPVASQDTKVLMAWLVTANQINPDEVLEKLKLQLPAYMIPARFYKVTDLPLTTSGKLDVNALLKIAREDQPLFGAQVQLPQTDLQLELAGMMHEQLNREHIGIDENFFELGGNSIKAIRLLAGIRERFHVSLNMSRVFRNFSIRFIEQELEQALTAYAAQPAHEGNEERENVII